MFVRGILAGIVLTLALAAAGAYLYIAGGLMPAGADAKAPALERWAARVSLHATMRREATAPAQNPAAVDDQNFEAGIKLYGQNCAVCHGAADGKESNIAKGLYIKAPQLAKDGVEDDPPAVTYWKIKHGIRFTGMPAFGGLSDDQIWQITLFLQHMDGLPPGPKRSWERLPSAAGA
jgi:mono/diheme cytochrome c family protein